MLRATGLRGILPPYILDHMARSADPDVRAIARDAIGFSRAARALRAARAGLPAPVSPGERRVVYDAGHGGFEDLPGTPVRSEGEAATGDPAADEAYEGAGATYAFYASVFGRRSLDGHGMTLRSSVHFGRRYANAFWNGDQMVYGDGDGAVFLRFTRSLDVIGHELTHGVVAHACNLDYRGEPGALNEHFADVFGSLVKQWARGETAADADWLIGADLMGPQPEATAPARAIRTFKAERAFEDNPYLGTDPQPKHLRDLYTGSEDDGGVHINSGIPNHAFYRAALAIGGPAWTRAGAIWYAALLALGPASDFRAMVAATAGAAAEAFGAGSLEHRAVTEAWKAVGF